MTNSPVFRVFAVATLGWVLTSPPCVEGAVKMTTHVPKLSRKWNASATKRLASATASEIPALIAKGANPNGRNKDGIPFLVEAAAAPPRLWGGTPHSEKLLAQRRKERIERTRALLTAGANPNAVGSGRLSALDFAIAPWDNQYDRELAVLIIEHGGKCRILDLKSYPELADLSLKSPYANGR